MSITNAGTNQHKGLFATLAPGGAISAVGLINPVVSNGGLTAIGFGALVGHNKGTIYASWVRGGNISASEEETYIGGLVGRNGASASERGTIRASYSTATVSNNNHEFSQTGGLVGNYDGPTSMARLPPATPPARYKGAAPTPCLAA